MSLFFFNCFQSEPNLLVDIHRNVVYSRTERNIVQNSEKDHDQPQLSQTLNQDSITQNYISPNTMLLAVFIHLKPISLCQLSIIRTEYGAVMQCLVLG